MPINKNDGSFASPKNQELAEKKLEEINRKKEEALSKKKEETVVFTASDPIYKLDDIILSDKCREDLLTVINSKRNWDKVFIEWGLGTVMKQNKGLFINLHGESGTGKSMSAHAIAYALEKKIICVNYADIESKYVGETSKNLTRLFTYAKENDFIIFFDEADALLSKRVTNMSSSTDVSVNQTRSVLLTLLNDYNGMVLFATNFISNYDAAFMRRIQFHVKFELPNEEMRKKLWEMYIPEALPAEIDIDKIAHDHDNLSGSDISTAVLRAALKAANDNAETIPHSFFEDSVVSILNSKKENKGISDDGTTIEKRTVSEEYVKEKLGKDALDEKEN
jgi:SpoVK/Ycf46/Vps4 family AAA+-type ATPase